MSAEIVTQDTRHATASMVVLDAVTEKVLLVWHLGFQQWVFPGGHVDPNEFPHECAVREVQEETGIRAHVATSFMINGSDMPPGAKVLPMPLMVSEFPIGPKNGEPAHTHIDFLYLGTPLSSEITAQEDEVGQVGWFSLSEISWLHEQGKTRSEVYPVAKKVLY